MDPLHSGIGWLMTYPNNECYGGLVSSDYPWGGQTPYWCANWRKSPEPLNPKKYGAICDGKHDDTEAFERVMELASINGDAVSIPDNCVLHNWVLPNIKFGAGTFKGMKQ